MEKCFKYVKKNDFKYHKSKKKFHFLNSPLYENRILYLKSIDLDETIYFALKSALLITLTVQIKLYSCKSIALNV